MQNILSKVLYKPAQGILEGNPKHDDKSSIMTIKVYAFSYLAPGEMHKFNSHLDEFDTETYICSDIYTNTLIAC